MTEALNYLDSFLEVLHRLASPAEEQARYLTKLGVAGSLDELALEFDDLYRPLGPVLPSLANGPEIASACLAIDRAFQDPNIGWGFEDLDMEEWARIREVAADAHELLSRILRSDK